MRCLCLNISYEPLGFLSQNRAVQVVLENRAEIVERGERTYSSTSGVVVPEPVVIRLNRYIKMPRDLSENISSRVLFARDNHTCQYCAKHVDELSSKNPLTIDHILPKSKGGPHHWENVVTACYRCNLKKRDRTPTDANMEFKDLYKARSPKKPSSLIISWGGKASEVQEKWIKQFYKIDSLNGDIG